MSGSKRVHKLCLAVAATAVALLAVEAALRIAGYRYSPLSIRHHQAKLEQLKKNPFDYRLYHRFSDEHFIHDPDLIWRPKPGFLFFNRQGYRGQELARPKPPREYRIFAIGDSNTLGCAHGSVCNWPQELERLLRRVDSRFVVTNAGAYGYASLQGLVRLREALRWNPDMVLISFGANDAHRVSVSDAEFLAATLAPRMPWLGRLRLGQLVWAVSDRLLTRSPQPQLVHRVSPAEYRENLVRILDLCQERNLPCLLLTRPYLGTDDQVAYWRTYAPEYRRVTLAVGQERGAPVIDLYAVCRDARELFEDESHFTPQGHFIAAATVVLPALIPTLLARGALKPSQAQALSQHPLDYVFLDIGTPAARAALQSGFSGNERPDGRTATWSEGEESTLRFELTPATRRPYQLSITAAAFHRVAPLDVSVAVNGTPAGTLRFDLTWSSQQLRIASERLLRGTNTVTLRYARTGRPAAPSRDTRLLALFYDRLTLLPVP